MSSVGLRLLRTSLLLAVMVLVLVGVAGASNGASFSDRRGDAGSGRSAAPDISNVAVSTDDGGLLTVRVSLANRSTALDSNDSVYVALDLDQNPDTGSLLYGAEVSFGLQGSSLAFFRPDGSGLNFIAATAPPSLHGTFANGVATFTVKASDLGMKPTGGFNIFVHTENRDYNDEAPNYHTSNYQLVAGTAQPALGPDTRAPVDVAYASSGKRGHVVDLNYSPYDGRGQTADVVRVYNKRRVIKVFQVTLGDVDPFFVYYQPWYTPRNIRGPLRFCVVSADAAGNNSNTACAKVTLR
jgi:hypothetical protein